ncbi:MAG: two-component system sensor histidine kinase NtrB [Elusimicrobiota bacterium]
MTAKDKIENNDFERRALALYQAFKQSSDVMFYTDQNGAILEVNDAFTKSYGYTAQEALGKTPRLFRSKKSDGALYEQLWSDLLLRGHWHGRIINRSKAGREIPVHLAITAVKNESGHVIGYISSALDMSSQEALQNRLTRLESMAGIGEMAAVMAHEIRNPLSSIVMATKQLSSDILSAEDRAMVISVLQEEGRRLGGLLDHFLAYARPREPRPSLNDLNALLMDICRAVQSNADLVGTVRIKTVLDGNLKPFPFDAEQMRQVAWNLLINGLQAMEGRGDILLETGLSGTSAFFRVKDSGPGVQPEARDCLFKPFYTTKNRGSGLGLATADRIIRAHHGKINVESAPGYGASFTVLIPITEA